MLLEVLTRPIKGYEDYFVNKSGDVYSKKYGTLKLLKYFDRKGYWAVHLYKKGRPTKKSVHRLIIGTYKRNPENKSQVNHIDGNTKNNYIGNLEWATPSENGKHAYSMGLSRKVEWSGTARICVVGTSSEGKVAEYSSIGEAARHTGQAETTIRRRTKDGKQFGGFSWRTK